MKVAAVLGDDVLEYCLRPRETLQLMETRRAARRRSKGEIVSANAYLGADVDRRGARHAAPTSCSPGRVGDCSLFLAPMIHEFGWQQDDWDLLGKGQAGADMVECGANVSGGFFADPGYKEVPDLGNLGYPFLEVEPDGTIVVTKLDGTGGIINRAICTEQMIYEIHDPANYITPDVVVDFTGVHARRDRARPRAHQRRARQAAARAAQGLGRHAGRLDRRRRDHLRGLGCLERAKLAEQVVRERLKIGGVKLQELRVDYIGTQCAAWRRIAPAAGAAVRSVSALRRPRARTSAMR